MLEGETNDANHKIISYSALSRQNVERKTKWYIVAYISFSSPNSLMLSSTPRRSISIISSRHVDILFVIWRISMKSMKFLFDGNNSNTSCKGWFAPTCRWEITQRRHKKNDVFVVVSCGVRHGKKQSDSRIESRGDLTRPRRGPKKRAIRKTYAASPSRCQFPHEITDISAGIGICIVAIKLPLRHAMAQLPDSGDAFVISRSRSRDSPPRLYLACASPPLFDPNITGKLLRTYSNSRASHRSTPVLRFRGANSSWNVILWPNRPQIASRISMYTPLESLATAACKSFFLFFQKFFFRFER